MFKSLIHLEPVNLSLQAAGPAGDDQPLGASAENKLGISWGFNQEQWGSYGVYSASIFHGI